jgi:hypothetical protein
LTGLWTVLCRASFWPSAEAYNRQIIIHYGNGIRNMMTWKHRDSWSHYQAIWLCQFAISGWLLIYFFFSYLKQCSEYLYGKNHLKESNDYYSILNSVIWLLLFSSDTPMKKTILSNYLVFYIKWWKKKKTF